MHSIARRKERPLLLLPAPPRLQPKEILAKDLLVFSLFQQNTDISPASPSDGPAAQAPRTAASSTARLPPAYSPVALRLTDVPRPGTRMGGRSRLCMASRPLGWFGGGTPAEATASPSYRRSCGQEVESFATGRPLSLARICHFLSFMPVPPTSVCLAGQHVLCIIILPDASLFKLGLVHLVHPLSLQTEKTDQS